jgi:hypothetical protein
MRACLRLWNPVRNSARAESSKMISGVAGLSFRRFAFEAMSGFNFDIVTQRANIGCGPPVWGIPLLPVGSRMLVCRDILRPVPNFKRYRFQRRAMWCRLRFPVWDTVSLGHRILAVPLCHYELGSPVTKLAAHQHGFCKRWLTISTTPMILFTRAIIPNSSKGNNSRENLLQ